MRKDLVSRCELSQIQVNIARLYSVVYPDPVEVEKVFDELNFNTLSSEESLMLAQAVEKNGFLGVPEKLLPRVKGVISYHVVKNTVVMCETAKLIGVLKEEGVNVLLCKGTAIKCLYGPNRVRHMWDADFSVKKEQYEQAISIARNNGYEGIAARHSVDLRGKSGNLADIHQIFMRELLLTGDTAVWSRAVSGSFYGQDVSVPCREDLVIQLLTNAALDFAQQPAPFKWVADMVNLLPKCDFDKLIACARELGVGAQTAFVLRILRPVLPELCDYNKLIEGCQSKDDGVTIKRLDKLSRSYHRYINAYSKKGTGYMAASLRAKWDEHSYLCGKQKLRYRLGAFPAFLKVCTGGKALPRIFIARLLRHRQAIG